MWRRPLDSLPARLGFFVLAATLCTSLVITAISLNSIDSFLREKTEESFPAILERTATELESWYAARATEADGFREDPVLASYWGDLMLAAPLAIHAREEITEQLDRRLARSPEFEAAFVLAPSGQVQIWRGRKIELSMGMREEIRRTALSRAGYWQGERFQILTVRFGDPGGATLHLLVDLDLLTETLQIHGRSLAGSISIVGPDRHYLASSSGVPPTGQFELALPKPGAVLGTVDSIGSQGEQLITSAMSLPRHGWTLVIEEEYDRAYARVVTATRRVLGINLTIVALFALVAYRFAVGMVRPIEALSEAARRISEGDKDISIPHSASTNEVGVLTRAFFEMTSRIEANSQELENAHRSVEVVNAELVTRNDELHRANEVLAQLSITD
ncbi:MAG: HAMP domain-containing protein, partial [bacterium]|nr:HAMP domain-containing protein [bacterium]